MEASGQTPVMNETDREAARTLSLRGSRPPVKVPGYEQEQFLGHGAYGEVWSAVSRNSGVKVAIKFYTRRGARDWASLAREVEKLRYLFSDRYVVQLLEVGWESDPPYYVMEYMENGSLEDLLRTGPLPVAEAVNYFREVAVALVHAHNKGILHCDLKPANILLDQDRRPRLADFGQARLTNEMSPALGTLFYMAPEQADLTANPDARWDVYALGAVAYCMLTGRPPHYQEQLSFSGDLQAQLAAYREFILKAPRPADHRRVPGVDAELAGIIDRCLETNPARRLPNPQAVVTAIDAWRVGQTRRPLLRLTVAVFIAVFLLVAGVGSYLFHTTIQTARESIIKRTLEANRFAARGEAQQMALETEHRWRILQFEAAKPELIRWLSEPPREGPVAPHALDRWLEQRREEYNRDFRKGAEATLWIALDRQGRMRGMSSEHARFRNQYFGYRDYFHGLGVNLPEQPPPDTQLPPIITKPHRSMVYRRMSTGGWAVTYSVPVRVASDQEPIGVLGMSVDLNQAEDTTDTDRFSVLVDLRPDAKGRRGLIVRHPYTAQLPPDMPDDQFPLYYAKQLLRHAEEGLLRPPEERPDGWDRIEAYFDPVGGPPRRCSAGLTDLFGGQGSEPTLEDHQRPFRGEWLTALNPVIVYVDSRPIDTGFLVAVQERKAEVLAPVVALRRKLLISGLGVGLGLTVVFALLWVMTVAILSDSPRSWLGRRIRRWAGLSSGGASGGSFTGGAGRTAGGSGRVTTAPQSS